MRAPGPGFKPSLRTRRSGAARPRQAGPGPGRYNPEAMELTEKQRKRLKQLAHSLKPVIALGNAGLTPAVVAETKRALHDHELIKVRFPGADREARDAALQALATETGSAMVTRIGHVAVLYRPAEPLPRIQLPG